VPTWGHRALSGDWRATLGTVGFTVTPSAILTGMDKQQAAERGLIVVHIRIVHSSPVMPEWDTEIAAEPWLNYAGTSMWGDYLGVVVPRIGEHVVLDRPIGDPLTFDARSPKLGRVVAVVHEQIDSLMKDDGPIASVFVIPVDPSTPLFDTVPN
jgi:hypothetical protein